MIQNPQLGMMVKIIDPSHCEYKKGDIAKIVSLTSAPDGDLFVNEMLGVVRESPNAKPVVFISVAGNQVPYQLIQTSCIVEVKPKAIRST